MADKNERLASLLKLSHELGNALHSQVILGEGNTSTRLNAEKFLVKASGTNLSALRDNEVVECNAAILLPLLKETALSDAEVECALMQSRAEATAKKPSVEALFHAWLLTLPEVEFIGHTHPVAVNGILCSSRAREFAAKRIFPDEIVCCDVESVFVPYTDPGLRLAQAIRDGTNAFIRRHQRIPRVILLENHGIIALGRTIEAVMAALLMAEKAATIWLGAASLGGPTFLTPEQVQRIATRPDEAMRRTVLKI